MKVVVCDKCRAAEDRAAGGLFNLAGNGMDIDICGACAAEVLGCVMNTAGEQVMRALALEQPTRPVERFVQAAERMVGRDNVSVQASQAVVDDIDQFIRSQAEVPTDHQRMTQLTAELGETVFIEELPSNPKIGSRVSLGMPGRKIRRRVEVVEALASRPGSYFVFQVKEE